MKPLVDFHLTMSFSPSFI